MPSFTFTRATQVLLVGDPFKMIGIHTRSVVAEMIPFQTIRDWPSKPVISVSMSGNSARSSDAKAAVALRTEGSGPEMTTGWVDNHLCVEPFIRRSCHRAVPKICLERPLCSDSFFGCFSVLSASERRGRLVTQHVPFSRIGKLAATAFTRVWGSTRSRLSSGASRGQMVTGDEPCIWIAGIHGLAAPTLTESNVRRPTKTLAHCLQLMPRDVPHGVALDPSSAAARLGSEGGRLFASALAVHGGIIP